MSWGILELIGSTKSLVFAILPAIAGVDFLVSGNLFVGVGLLGMALGMVVAEQYVTTPGDLPELVVSKVVDAVVRPPDEE